MVRASLIFRYQWLAFWRRVLRTGRLKFYLTTVTLLGGMAAVALPDSLSRAASELAIGQTASMETLLLVVCLLWLAVLCEDQNVSLNSDRLRRFPLDVRSLLALRLLSLSLSPLVWLATILSLLTLFPLLSARHSLLSSVAALIFFALTIGVGITVSQLRAVGRWARSRFVAVALLGILLLPFALGLTPAGARLLVTPPGMAANPASLVTDVAVAITPLAIAIPMTLLLVGSAAVWYLVRWSFLRSVCREKIDHKARRETSLARLPGRLGPLVQKEQRSIRKMLDIWMGLLPVLAGAAISFSVSLSSTVRQAIIVTVCALNANVTLNCLGLDRPAGLTRYLILPIRGKDLFFAKNMAVILVVAVQLTLLFVIGAWQSGVMPLGAEIVVASVVLLTHLAWGNIVSVFEPRRTEPHRFAPSSDLLTAMVSLLIGSTPGVAVIVLLRSDSPVTTWAIAVIVLLTMVAYYGSLRFAGSSLERRIERISRRLA